jgi:hypothetical protein
MNVFKVILTDKTEYPVAWCGCSSGSLTIALREGEMTELAQAFGDPEKTAVIDFEHDGAVTSYGGYTRLTALIDGRWQGMEITITMRQGA